MIEIERTFLAKELPSDLADYTSNEMIDVYIPKDAPHPVLRLRKKGSTYELTKKEVIVENDHSQFREQTIILTESEFNALFSQIEGKKLHKIRYEYPLPNGTAEIDVFQGALQGLVLVDVEFTSVDAKDTFAMPDFCLVDVTQSDFIAGGMLCGKSYVDIVEELAHFGYKLIHS